MSDYFKMNYGLQVPEQSFLTPGVMGGMTQPQGEPGGWSWLNQFNTDGKMTQQGMLSPALGVAQGLFGAYMGMKQYGLMKDQLNESKRQFGLNFDAQKRTTNAALADRQAARVASNSGAYQSVGEYMNQYGIRG
jgi:hypothetical protein